MRVIIIALFKYYIRITDISYLVWRDNIMSKNKTKSGKSNGCGRKIFELRVAMDISQKNLADRMMDLGVEFDKNAISNIELGKRQVSEIELRKFAKFFNVDINQLIDDDYED